MACGTSTAFPGGPPPRLALSLGDSLAGMFGAQGALAALYRRSVTGHGQVVDVALTESCLAVQESTIPDYDVGGVVRGPSGTRLEGIAPSNIYRSADGSWVVIAANQDTVFARLCKAMGRPELATDDRFATHGARGRNQDELDKIIGAWAAERQPAEIIETLSAAGVIAGPINTVAEVVDDPQLRARGMLVEHYDERIGPAGVGAGRHAGALGIAGQCPQRRLGASGPTQRRRLHRAARQDRRGARGVARRGGDLMTHVDIREVSLRDGLQIEKPIPLSAKLELLAAVAATGVREVEATAFVSPSKVPSMADAAELAAHLHNYPDIEFSALVASPNGAKRAVAAGLRSIEYVVAASDAFSNANVGRTSAEATEQIDEIVAIAHDSDVTVEVIVATAWDCPFEGPTPPQRVLDIAAAARDRGVDRFSHRRHHRHHHAAAGEFADRTTASGDRRAAAGRAFPQHPRRRAGQRVRGGQAGVTRLDASVGGLGGCPFAPGATGNIATEDLVYLLRDSDIDVDVDLQAAIAAAEVAKSVVGHDLPSALLRAGDRIQH